jgi:hypothetical protein
MNLSLRRSFDTLARRLAAPAIASALSLALLSLTACDSVVGSGNGPRRLVIVKPGTTAPLPTLKEYQCLTSALGARLEFDDGSAGDYSARVVWSSSNTGAVEVSSGNIPIPGTSLFYAGGTLIPHGPGSAVVTANYFGLETQIAITVGTPQNIHLAYLKNGLYLPLYQINLDQSSPRSTFTIGVGSTAQLAAVATLDGVETDVSQFATFGFQQSAAGIATIGVTNGILTGIGQGGPVVPVAQFSPCGLNNITDPNGIVTMTVQPILDLSVRSELAADPQQPISSSNPVTPVIAGNTEKFTAVADLANGDKQDVTSQTTMTTGDSSFAAFGGNGLLTSSAPGGPVVVSAVFSGGNTSLQASFFSTSVQQSQLSSILVCWSDPLQQDFNVYTAAPCKDPTDPAYAPPNPANPSVAGGSINPLQFHAIGIYGLNDAGTGLIYQEVTRGTTWTATDPTAATISNAALNAGQAHAATVGPASTTINATDNIATNISTVLNQLFVQPADLSGDGNPLP